MKIIIAIQQLSMRIVCHKQVKIKKNYYLDVDVTYLPTLHLLDGVSVFFISPKYPSAEIEISVF